jgi:hypothetical protein
MEKAAVRVRPQTVPTMGCRGVSFGGKNVERGGWKKAEEVSNLVLKSH